MKSLRLKVRDIGGTFKNVNCLILVYIKVNEVYNLNAELSHLSLYKSE